MQPQGLLDVGFEARHLAQGLMADVTPLGVEFVGELVILDPAKGQHEADGVVQRIPGYGQEVEPLIEDQLVDNSWPKFLHPYPLSDKYFLVAAQPSAKSLWGIYLVDIFDNVVLIKEQPGYALLEPVPFRKAPRPPVRSDIVDLDRYDSIVFIADVYEGPGLAGIPPGTVKKLRLFTYTFDYPGMGGPQGVVGLEGPWDVRRSAGPPVRAVFHDQSHGAWSGLMDHAFDRTEPPGASCGGV